MDSLQTLKRNSPQSKLTKIGENNKIIKISLSFLLIKISRQTNQLENKIQKKQAVRIQRVTDLHNSKITQIKISRLKINLV